MIDHNMKSPTFPQATLPMSTVSTMSVSEKELHHVSLRACCCQRNFPESHLTYDRCRCVGDQEEKSEAKKLHLHQDDPHLLSTCSGLSVSHWPTVVMVLPTITILVVSKLTEILFHVFVEESENVWLGGVDKVVDTCPRSTLPFSLFKRSTPPLNLFSRSGIRWTLFRIDTWTLVIRPGSHTSIYHWLISINLPMAISIWLPVHHFKTFFKKSPKNVHE